jgi:hypothetical protein
MPQKKRGAGQLVYGLVVAIWTASPAKVAAEELN